MLASGELSADTRGSFTFGTRIGLLLIAQVACISFILVGGLLTVILVRAILTWRHERRRLHWPSNLHILFISLLVADLLQALGSIFDLKWVVDAGVIEGPFCTAQAIVKHMGDTAVALTTMAIAFQTFFIIVCRWKMAHSPRVALSVTGAIWLFMVLAVGIGSAVHNSSPEPFYGNTRYWCWIRNPPYRNLSIALQYFWMWFAAFSTFVLYGISWVVWRRSEFTARQSRSEDTLDRDQDNAIRMLWYPIIYTITVLPISITRFIQFQHPNPPPFPATAFAGVLLGSSGIFNVLLFALTRPALLSIPITDTRDSDEKPATFETGLIEAHPVTPSSFYPPHQSQVDVWPADAPYQENLLPD